MSEKIEQKSINNAIAAYLMLGISGLLLFNKTPYTNNDFVKSHIKSSMVIHLLLVLNYVIFIHFDFLGRINIGGIGLNIIVADLIFFFIGILFVKGIYSATNSKEQKIGNSIKFSAGIGLDINNDHTFDEKDKLTIILSYIPFVGYIISSKYKNTFIQNILKLNLIISLILVILHIYLYANITSLFALIYIIFIIFSGVYLYGKDGIISINLPDYLSPKGLLKLVKNCSKYLYYYLKGNFQKFEDIEKKYNENEAIEETKAQEELKTLAETKTLGKLKLPKILDYLIYVPIINLIFLFVKDNNHKYHIRNGLTLNFVFIAFLILNHFGYFHNKTNILFLFPIAFGTGMLPIKYYKMPFIYEIYEGFAYFKQLFTRTHKIIKEKSKEVHEESLKIE